MTTPTLEIGWIVACLRALDRHAAPPPPRSLRWDRVLAVAAAEGVAPALGFVWKADAAPVPSGVGERVGRDVTESTARHLVLSMELDRLLEAFDQESIPVMPLKGPALAEALYPHPGLRPCTDLDLLIERHALTRADTLLQRLDYKRVADDHSWSFDVAYDRATLYASRGGVHVDLHWSLLSDPRFSWNEAGGLTVWQRADKTRVGGRPASCLGVEDLVLYLAMHLAVHHGLSGLLWYWDLTRLLERSGNTIDWETIVARAAYWRVRRALYFALHGCQWVFGVTAPPAVMSRLKPRGPRAAALRWLVARCDAERLRKLEHVIALLLIDRTRDLIRSLAAVVFPSPTWLRARYTTMGRSLGACYLAHWWRITGIVRAATWAATRRSVIARRER